MARLTKEQEDFLAHHDIPLSSVFDASGLKRREYSEIMRGEDKDFAYGVTECLNGHTLRNRSGGCIQCRTSRIAFQMRHRRSSYVYIAGSLASQLIKIGSSNEPNNRIYIANLDGYANSSDWQPLFQIHVQQAGRIESDIQSKLRPYQRRINFVRNGSEQVATECFACSYEQAYSKLVTTLLGVGIFKGKQWRAPSETLARYEFGEL